MKDDNNKYLNFLRYYITDYSKHKFSTLEGCNKGLHNAALGLFNLVLTNTNHDLFERNVELEKQKLKESYIVLQKYIAEARIIEDLEPVKEKYNFFDGVNSFLNGILEITDTKNNILDDSYNKLNDYKIAFAGDCIDMISNILMNEQ